MGATFLELWTVGGPDGPERHLEMATARWQAWLHRDGRGCYLRDAAPRRLGCRGPWPGAPCARPAGLRQGPALRSHRRHMTNAQRERLGYRVLSGPPWRPHRSAVTVLARAARRAPRSGLMADQKPAEEEAVACTALPRPGGELPPRASGVRWPIARAGRPRTGGVAAARRGERPVRRLRPLVGTPIPARAGRRAGDRAARDGRLRGDDRGLSQASTSGTIGAFPATGSPAARDAERGSTVECLAPSAAALHRLRGAGGQNGSTAGGVRCSRRGERVGGPRWHAGASPRPPTWSGHRRQPRAA